jgi:hypothetical protein
VRWIKRAAPIALGTIKKFAAKKPDLSRRPETLMLVIYLSIIFASISDIKIFN